MEDSFVVTYRDRDPEAVRRNLSSLMKQETEITYEICFVDYGSQEHNRQQIHEFVNDKKLIKYQYIHTRGWLWCRSHANNIGIDNAASKYIIMVDVDLIYPPFFLEKIHQYMHEKCLLLY
jgi:glycosyltransferase involved in cell wall biosynthesis